MYLIPENLHCFMKTAEVFNIKCFYERTENCLYGVWHNFHASNFQII